MQRGGQSSSTSSRAPRDFGVPGRVFSDETTGPRRWAGFNPWFERTYARGPGADPVSGAVSAVGLRYAGRNTPPRRGPASAVPGGHVSQEGGVRVGGADV